MVDEIYEVQQYLAGENIKRDNLYRMCFLISCYYQSQGLGKSEIHHKIHDWGKMHYGHIEYDVNAIVDRVFSSNRSALKSHIVKINKQDVSRIKSCFDNHKVQKVALALLCYAKAYSNVDGEFFISAVSLGAWMKINRKSIRNKYVKRLIDYDYLIELGKPCAKNYRSSEFDKQATRYKLNASLHNSGEYVLENNDIDKLFSEAF